MNGAATNSRIKTSSRKFKHEKFSYNKMSDPFTKEICLGKLQTFLEYMKSAALKQNNMTTIFQEHRNKSKPYIFTYDPKFIIYLTFEMKYKTMQCKRLYNNSKVFVEQKNNNIYT